VSDNSRPELETLCLCAHAYMYHDPSGDSGCLKCGCLIFRQGFVMPMEPSNRAIEAAQDVLSPDRIGMDVYVRLTTELVARAVRAAFAAQRGNL
jgi:predicted  nucleic acid-binding Zn-ribbon protein